MMSLDGRLGGSCLFIGLRVRERCSGSSAFLICCSFGWVRYYSSISELVMTLLRGDSNNMCLLLQLIQLRILLQHAKLDPQVLDPSQQAYLQPYFHHHQAQTRPPQPLQQSSRPPQHTTMRKSIKPSQPPIHHESTNCPLNPKTPNRIPPLQHRRQPILPRLQPSTGPLKSHRALLQHSSKLRSWIRDLDLVVEVSTTTPPSLPLVIFRASFPGMEKVNCGRDPSFEVPAVERYGCRAEAGEDDGVAELACEVLYE
ncbi:hypothetical protein N431DRAFT_225129 [Stipitochalara longipes BDJ]|nr:hypothetical protein N431DRAFT_225129 [Stipitochalara longipes BDJ]